MNIIHIVINDFSEIDFDDLYERSRDAVDANWPESSVLTNAERKANMIALVKSGMNDEWPGLNTHSPNDRYIVVKYVDLDTEKIMGFGSGYLIEGGIFDGRHSLAAPDENGSRNYLYSEQSQIARKNFHDAIGITHALLRNIPANSVQHRMVRIRANAGTYDIIEDVNSPIFGAKFRNILIKYL